MLERKGCVGQSSHGGQETQNKLLSLCYDSILCDRRETVPGDAMVIQMLCSHYAVLSELICT